MNYGYARASIINQYLDKQIDELHKVGVLDSQIFIDDVVLQVLSILTDNERKTMKQRKAEGTRMAKLREVKFVRPSTPTPDDFGNTVIHILF